LTDPNKYSDMIERLSRRYSEVLAAISIVDSPGINDLPSPSPSYNHFANFRDRKQERPFRVSHIWHFHQKNSGEDVSAPVVNVSQV